MYQSGLYMLQEIQSIVWKLGQDLDVVEMYEAAAKALFYELIYEDGRVHPNEVDFYNLIFGEHISPEAFEMMRPEMQSKDLAEELLGLFSGFIAIEKGLLELGEAAANLEGLTSSLVNGLDNLGRTLIACDGHIDETEREKLQSIISRCRSKLRDEGLTVETQEELIEDGALEEPVTGSNKSTSQPSKSKDVQERAVETAKIIDELDRVESTLRTNLEKLERETAARSDGGVDEVLELKGMGIHILRGLKDLEEYNSDALTRVQVLEQFGGVEHLQELVEDSKNILQDRVVSLREGLANIYALSSQLAKNAGEVSVELRKQSADSEMRAAVSDTHTIAKRLVGITEDLGPLWNVDTDDIDPDVQLSKSTPRYRKEFADERGL